MERERQIFFNVDALEPTHEGTKIKGWAFSGRGEVKISLGDNIPCEVKRIRRTDVVSAFSSREGLNVPEYAGFELLFSPEGKKSVVLCISDDVEKVEAKQRLAPGNAEKFDRFTNILGTFSRKFNTRNIKRFFHC